MTERLKQGMIVSHFKRDPEKHKYNNMYLYRILYFAEHTESGELMVVYQALYGDLKVYVRSYDLFVGEVDHEKYPDVRQTYRFEEFKTNF